MLKRTFILTADTLNSFEIPAALAENIVERKYTVIVKYTPKDPDANVFERIYNQGGDAASVSELTPGSGTPTALTLTSNFIASLRADIATGLYQVTDPPGVGEDSIELAIDAAIQPEVGQQFPANNVPVDELEDSLIKRDLEIRYTLLYAHLDTSESSTRLTNAQIREIAREAADAEIDSILRQRVDEILEGSAAANPYLSEQLFVTRDSLLFSQSRYKGRDQLEGYLSTSDRGVITANDTTDGQTLDSNDLVTINRGIPSNLSTDAYKINTELATIPTGSRASITGASSASIDTSAQGLPATLSDREGHTYDVNIPANALSSAGNSAARISNVKIEYRANPGGGAAQKRYIWDDAYYAKRELLRVPVAGQPVEDVRLDHEYTGNIAITSGDLSNAVSSDSNSNRRIIAFELIYTHEIAVPALVNGRDLIFRARKYDRRKVVPALLDSNETIIISAADFNDILYLDDLSGLSNALDTEIVLTQAATVLGKTYRAGEVVRTVLIAQTLSANLNIFARDVAPNTGETKVSIKELEPTEEGRQNFFRLTTGWLASNDNLSWSALVGVRRTDTLQSVDFNQFQAGFYQQAPSIGGGQVSDDVLRQAAASAQEAASSASEAASSASAASTSASESGQARDASDASRQAASGFAVSASGSETAAAGSATAAATSATNAANSATEAQTAAAGVRDISDEVSQVNAARDATLAARTQAVAARGDAEASKDAAATSATAAAGSATTASTSANNAATSAQTATNKAAEAAASATAAEAAKTATETAAAGVRDIADEVTAAEAAKDAAEAAQTAAETAQTGAETAQTAAEAAQTAAGTSETNAAASATAAATSETNAGTSETNAATSATEAAASATTASNAAAAVRDISNEVDQVNAARDAAVAAQTAAETAETNAETAETNAESAQSAAETAQAAAESARDTASARSGSAATSAVSAANSASAAATSESDAETHEMAAEAAQTAAETARDAAQASQTAAATSATNAATSENTANTEATTATTQANNAATSATNAAASASQAATSASAAATSAQTAEDAANRAGEGGQGLMGDDRTALDAIKRDAVIVSNHEIRGERPTNARAILFQADPGTNVSLTATLAKNTQYWNSANSHAGGRHGAAFEYAGVIIPKYVSSDADTERVIRIRFDGPVPGSTTGRTPGDHFLTINNQATARDSDGWPVNFGRLDIGNVDYPGGESGVASWLYFIVNEDSTTANPSDGTSMRRDQGVSLEGAIASGAHITFADQGVTVPSDTLEDQTLVEGAQKGRALITTTDDLDDKLDGRIGWSQYTVHTGPVQYSYTDTFTAAAAGQDVPLIAFRIPADVYRDHLRSGGELLQIRRTRSGHTTDFELGDLHPTIEHDNTAQFEGTIPQTAIAVGDVFSIIHPADYEYARVQETALRNSESIRALQNAPEDLPAGDRQFIDHLKAVIDFGTDTTVHWDDDERNTFGIERKFAYYFETNNSGATRPQQEFTDLTGVTSVDIPSGSRRHQSYYANANDSRNTFRGLHSWFWLIEQTLGVGALDGSSDAGRQRYKNIIAFNYEVHAHFRLMEQRNILKVVGTDKEPLLTIDPVHGLGMLIGYGGSGTQTVNDEIPLRLGLERSGPASGERQQFYGELPGHYNHGRTRVHYSFQLQEFIPDGHHNLGSEVTGFIDIPDVNSNYDSLGGTVRFGGQRQNGDTVLRSATFSYSKENGRNLIANVADVESEKDQILVRFWINEQRTIDTTGMRRFHAFGDTNTKNAGHENQVVLLTRPTHSYNDPTNAGTSTLISVRPLINGHVGDWIDTNLTVSQLGLDGISGGLIFNTPSTNMGAVSAYSYTTIPSYGRLGYMASRSRQYLGMFHKRVGTVETVSFDAEVKAKQSDADDAEITRLVDEETVVNNLMTPQAYDIHVTGAVANDYDNPGQLGFEAGDDADEWTASGRDDIIDYERIDLPNNAGHRGLFTAQVDCIANVTASVNLDAGRGSFVCVVLDSDGDEVVTRQIRDAETFNTNQSTMEVAGTIFLDAGESIYFIARGDTSELRANVTATARSFVDITPQAPDSPGTPQTGISRTRLDTLITQLNQPQELIYSTGSTRFTGIGSANSVETITARGGVPADGNWGNISGGRTDLLEFVNAFEHDLVGGTTVTKPVVIARKPCKVDFRIAGNVTASSGDIFEMTFEKYNKIGERYGSGGSDLFGYRWEASNGVKILTLSYVLNTDDYLSLSGIVNRNTGNMSSAIIKYTALARELED